MVTGPSFTDCTAMSAPNAPCSTWKPRARHRSRKVSYRGMATAGGAALVNPGRRLLISAYRVNWETTSRAPPTAARFKFIFPASSAKTRRPQILSASFSAWAWVSLGPMPSSTRKPVPMAPTVAPSMETEAEDTLVTTARIRVLLLFGFWNGKHGIQYLSIARGQGNSQRSLPRPGLFSPGPAPEIWPGGGTKGPPATSYEQTPCFLSYNTVFHFRLFPLKRVGICFVTKAEKR